jgi:hypothetical protein
MGILIQPKRKQPSSRAMVQGKQIYSKYVMQRLQSTKWQDRQTIFDLIEIEHSILDGVHGTANVMGTSPLMQKYPEETRALEAELYAADQFELRKHRKEQAERLAEEAKRVRQAGGEKTEEEIRQEWLTLGGKP